MMEPEIIGNREKRMCGAKHRHPTEESARKEKKKLEKKDAPNTYNVYQCPFCHYWHTGRQRVKEVES